MIPYGRHFITEEDEQAVLKALRGDFLTQGPLVEEFEKSFAQYVGSRFAVAVTNGTAALHLSALALGVGPGDRVLVPANTFVASANCVLYCGGEVEFVDIDERTLCIDIVHLENKLRAKPKGYYKGVIPVDFAGFPVNLEVIRKLADEFELWVLEDACHAPGASFKNSKSEWSKCGSGEWAELSVFSFHPVKHIACGEGGMITTNNADLYRKLIRLRTHGITKNPSEMIKLDGPWYYEMQELGFNYRIPDILCALGNSQLKRATQRFLRRQELALKYDELLSGKKIQLPFRNNEIEHSFHLYVIQVQNREKVFNHLRANGINPQVHYIPVNEHPYYQKRYGISKLENASKYYDQCLSLPMFPELTTDQVEYICKVLTEVL